MERECKRLMGLWLCTGQEVEVVVRGGRGSFVVQGKIKELGEAFLIIENARRVVAVKYTEIKMISWPKG